MAAVVLNSRHALEEILNNMQSRDLIKARLVLEHFSSIDLKEQRRILLELDKCEDNHFALPLLIFLISTNREISSSYPTITETITAKALDTPEALIELLQEDGPGQVYVISLAGDLRLQKAVPALLEILRGNTDAKILRHSLKALGLIADPDGVNAISEFLYTEEESLVAGAIEALGRIATPTAIQRLAERLGTIEQTDILIIDIFASVQDEISLRKLNEALQSRSASIRNYSRSKMVDIGGKVIPILSANLFFQDPDLQILSLNILSQIGDSSAFLPVRKLLNSHPRDANIRFAAYETLANLPGRKGDYVLANGMTDPDDNVRMAAARAIDHNFDAILGTGIRNMIHHQDADSVRVAKAVIDAQTEQLFLGLIDDEYFQKIAFPYIGKKVHRDIRDFYIAILQKAKKKNLVVKILGLTSATMTTQKKTRICAVDDSKLILSVYRSILTELGYDPVLFQFPAAAIAWLRQEKPAAVCTDLNMPEITGIELIRQVRTIYPKSALPILMVTTQNEMQDNKAAYDAGVTAIMPKPFDAEKLRRALNDIL